LKKEKKSSKHHCNRYQRDLNSDKLINNKTGREIEMKTATVQEVIEILNRVEDKNLPLIFVTKHLKKKDVDDGILYSGNPNSTAYYFDGPKEYIHLELLPLRD
jgi:hypothetical protein